MAVKRVTKKSTTDGAEKKHPLSGRAVLAQLESLRRSIKQLRNDRITKDELEVSIKNLQNELVAAMRSVDPDNHGIVYDPDNEEKGAAYVQQNSGAEVWDEEAIIEYLHQRKSRWIACSSRVFDVQKWEAEIAAGSIPKKTAKKFLKKMPDSSPFVRFGKIKRGSNL